MGAHTRGFFTTPPSVRRSSAAALLIITMVAIAVGAASAVALPSVHVTVRQRAQSASIYQLKAESTARCAMADPCSLTHASRGGFDPSRKPTTYRRWYRRRKWHLKQVSTGFSGRMNPPLGCTSSGNVLAPRLLQTRDTLPKNNDGVVTASVLRSGKLSCQVVARVR